MMMIHDTDFNRKQLIRVGQEFLLIYIYIYILYPFFLSSPPNRLLFDFSYYNMFVTFLCFFLSLFPIQLYPIYKICEAPFWFLSTSICKLETKKKKWFMFLCISSIYNKWGLKGNFNVYMDLALNHSFEIWFWLEKISLRQHACSSFMVGMVIDLLYKTNPLNMIFSWSASTA